jgi:hypothetical protein
MDNTALIVTQLLSWRNEGGYNERISCKGWHMLRSFLLTFSPKLQRMVIIGVTVLLSLIIALTFRLFFDTHLLEENTDLISAVYQALGMLYAILLTFTLWGVWQNFSEADDSVQREAYTLMDLMHMIEAVPRWEQLNIRPAALNYCNLVLDKEWPQLKIMSNEYINMKEASSCEAMKVVGLIQKIVPEGERELAIFSQMLNMLSAWLDSRRKRLLLARGNSAKALWPLLLTGALVMFAFHGLFVAKAMGIWLALLFGFSLVVGLTFYLIFTLDCPFAGFPSIDPEPFKFAVNVLKHKSTTL